MESTILHLAETYRYWILFPLACFEGPFTSILVGFLISLGVFNPFAAYGLMILGDILPDGFYYSLGRFGKRSELIRKYGSRVGITEERFAVVERLWRTHPGRTMWTGKLAYGFSIWFLISAGLSGMRAGKFFFWAVPVTLSQYGILMLLGYFFGSSYRLISQVFSGVEALMAAVVVGGGLYIALTHYMRRRLLRQGKVEEVSNA